MAAWSGLLRSAGQILTKNRAQTINANLQNGTITRYMSGGHDRVFPIQPSRWMWDKTKDLFHLYFMVAAIPLTVGITLANIFIGPATLTEIPEGYIPKEWEYYRSPTTRFLQKYLLTTDQQEYEKYCHFLWTEQEVIKIRVLEKKVKDLMSKRHDYHAYYHLPYTNADYVRRMAQKEQDRQNLYSGIN